MGVNVIEYVILSIEELNQFNADDTDTKNAADSEAVIPLNDPTVNSKG